MGMEQNMGGIAGGYPIIDAYGNITIPLDEIGIYKYLLWVVDNTKLHDFGLYCARYDALTEYIGLHCLRDGVPFMYYFSGASPFLAFQAAAYAFKRVMADNTIYFMEQNSGEYCAKIVRQGANDYRLYIKQGGAWVVK